MLQALSRKQCWLYASTKAMPKLMGLCLLMVCISCELQNPSIVIQNNINAHTLIKNISVNGCIWPEVVAFKEHTNVQNCLPGSDRIHFEKLDIIQYYAELCEDSYSDAMLHCEGFVFDASSMDIQSNSFAPRWFNYQTQATFEFQRNQSHVISVNSNNIEQDFSVPGPYGH